MMLQERIQQYLDKRKSENLYRTLSLSKQGADFQSNDYLGYSRCIPQLIDIPHASGSTGSRLISGNYAEIVETEKRIAEIHHAEDALFFSSGYMANFALLSALPSRADLILWDELCHASIVDGIRHSKAKHFKFKHNDVGHLHSLLQKHASRSEAVFVVSESLFSMDGDFAPVEDILNVCDHFKNSWLILDEAHALGTSANHLLGVGHNFAPHHRMLARLFTYGKALGAMGAGIVGKKWLKEYLINFARPVIYSTAPAPYLVLTVMEGYRLLLERKNLNELENIKTLFRLRAKNICGMEVRNGPIQTITFPIHRFNDSDIEKYQMEEGILCKYVRYPTVPRGRERFRITLHAYNTADELDRLMVWIERILSVA